MAQIEVSITRERIRTTLEHKRRKSELTGTVPYGWDDLCFNSFTCVAVDEGTRMKGENTLVGLGVRQLTPKYRLVSTATPIKNRLPDIFRLAWWVTGGREEAHARFPYANSSADRGDFAEEFLVSEHNLSAKKRRNPRYKKLTPNVCNVHRLWKMMAPIILRRRKHDIGEQIVSKHRHVIRAAMGTHQAETYKYHLRASYLDKNGRPAPGAKLQALRMAAAAPHAENLVPVLNGKGSHRSHTGYIPKIASALNLINQILRRGEQVVVGSAFIEPLNTLSCLLKEANVRHLRMDGSVSQTRRGMLSAQFKQGGPKYNPHASAKNLYPVTLAGVESCAEGHNWSRGKNVILIGFSWAFDKFEQLINRVHRLNSPEDVHVYKEEEAYNIFETLNDRGLRLSVPDLVANLLLKRCAGDAARKAVREQWNALLQQMGKRDVSRFLRHYWISRFGDVKSRGLYSEIKDHLAANKIDSLTFASGCTEECEDYVKLIDLSVPVSKWVIRDLEAMVKHHGALSSMPLLLSGYRCLNSSDFEKLLKCVVALYVRYSLITNQDPAGLETAFFNAAREIRSKHESKVVSAKCLAAAKAILNKINPTDALVEEKGKELILPEGAAKWFVTELANAVQSKTKEIGMDKANVEHIFPQNAGAEWPTRKQLEPLIWHVGNLTILGRRINTKAQNKAFKEKCKEHYSKSEIKMTTELLKETDWTPEVIHKRAANLAKQMTHLWQ